MRVYIPTPPSPPTPVPLSPTVPGFLGSPHTMVTYTRCMDSILCVPLMIDAAVWCDYFARTNVPQEQVRMCVRIHVHTCALDSDTQHTTTHTHTHHGRQAAMATAYLFKVPEGAAKGCDPGFFHQMVRGNFTFYFVFVVVRVPKTKRGKALGADCVRVADACSPHAIPFHTPHAGARQ